MPSVLCSYPCSSEVASEQSVLSLVHLAVCRVTYRDVPEPEAILVVVSVPYITVIGRILVDIAYDFGVESTQSRTVHV